MKIQFICLTALLCYSTCAFGQVDIPKQLPKNRFLLSGYLTPGLLLTTNKSSSYLIEDRHGDLHGLYGIGAHLGLQCLLDKQIISFGVGYALQGYTISNETPSSFIEDLLLSFWSSSQDTDFPFYKVTYTNHYFSLPIAYGFQVYRSESGKGHIYFFGGLDNLFFVKTDIDVRYFKENSPASAEEDAARKALLQSFQNENFYQANVAVGIGFNITIPSLHSGFRFRIYNQTMLTTINREFLGRAYGVGFDMGIYYAFAKRRLMQLN